MRIVLLLRMPGDKNAADRTKKKKTRNRNQKSVLGIMADSLDLQLGAPKNGIPEKEMLIERGGRRLSKEQDQQDLVDLDQ